MESNLEALFHVYPVLKRIEKENNGVIGQNGIFKKVYADEFVVSKSEESCSGVLFVIKGNIKIQKINAFGEETNLYNIKSGEFCHEALSCLSNLDSLNIVGRAIQDSYIFIIPFNIVNKYLIEDKEFLLFMYKDLHKKFNVILKNKENLVHEPLEKRLIKLLISKKSKIIYGTHNDLAFEIDTAREVVSRKLKKIENLGYIKLERGKIIVLKDLKELL
ncbi:MAG: Crp/Fnr family transcriptional regulator [Clostridiales bacterium]|nr:Crp/Fnr family transcriptional regulator [Clostridiales bacterium]